MKVRILGSAAGGGFPQWNCNCKNCSGVRHGTIAATPRTQSSIAVSGDGLSWVLFNASPDLPSQIRSFDALQPERELRDTAITDVVLVDAQLDHTLGLLLLREGHELRVWCTEAVHDELTEGHPIFDLLDHYCGVKWQRLPIEPGSSFRFRNMASVRCEAIPVGGTAPPFSVRRAAPDLGDSTGLRLTEERTGRSLFYAPGVGAVDAELETFLGSAQVLLMDGSFWSDDELIRLGISHRSARQMGHLPQSGPGGMLELFERLPTQRKILTHVNNTNPILDEHSAEREALRRAGVEVAHDGMEVEL